MVPLEAHAPSAINQRGSAICMYTSYNTGDNYKAIEPKTSNIKERKGEKKGKKEKKKEKTKEET
ncbi:hypothetical protein, partial [Sphingobacterium daejeonense]|uniref:hypothetical protein n=1 Tax=Sphingobacterium daejeonense TaxID=371142 RepID=UPI003D317541